ncbi:MAG: T9SS type A sorting domain-containing protein [Bacteroidales bacterium]|nr:T9SS type A sorting domain-containing protein [Bacteroidales bacterium]
MKTKLFIITLFTLFYFNQLSFGQINQATKTIGTGTNQIDLSIVVNSQTGVVQFTMTGPATKWFGIGFAATSMSSGSYGILANVGAGNPQEYMIQGQTTPSLQSNQNLTNISSSTAGGRKTYIFSRALSTGDANDYSFPLNPTSINIIWAYGNSTSLAYHSSRGVTSLVFTNPCNLPVTNLGLINICTGDSALIFGVYQHQAGNYTDTLTSQLGCDSIITQQLVVSQDINFQLPDVSVCHGDSALIFGVYQKSSGIFYDTISGSGSTCDSILSVNFTVQQSLDTTVSVSGSTLTCNQTADSYQWFDCSTNLPISGATQASFVPSQTGSYMAMITLGNCSASTACQAVVINSMSLATMNPVKVWPNPVKDVINISFNQNSSIRRFEIVDLSGKTILKSEISGAINAINISDLANGLYILNLEDEAQNRYFVKFIKQ